MKKKRILKLVALFLLFLLPFVFVLSVALIRPPVYGKTFVSELAAKEKLLSETEGEKLVVVGGSSVAFGLDSALLSEYLGMPVVNFGLYAALGTKLMLDLSQKKVGKGDIVVIAPELDPQTLSLYFNSETTWQAVESDPSLLLSMKAHDLPFMLGGAFRFAGDKLGYLMKNATPEVAGAYTSEVFNEYGDVIYPRPENTMPGGYDRNGVVTLDPAIFSADFLDYLNDYIAAVRKRGAAVYYSFPPINELALAAGTDEEAIARFEEFVADRIDCPVVSSLSDSILDPGYFFDTNFHTNDAGRTVRTVRLIKDLLFELGDPRQVAVDLPDPVPVRARDTAYAGKDDNDRFFTYQELEDGSLAITGLSDEGKAMTELTLPVGANGRLVFLVERGAFAGSGLQKLTVPENTALVRFADGCFADCSSLAELWIHIRDASQIIPPNSFAGTSARFTVHVPEGSSFRTDYYWSERSLTFVEDAE